MFATDMLETVAVEKFVGRQHFGSGPKQSRAECKGFVRFRKE